MEQYDVTVIGAGAAGMTCAIACARRGRRVLVIEHNRAPGEKIRISGGGRCNFTNLHVSPTAYLSKNPRFAISALTRYSQWDVIAQLDDWGIAWHEKTLGQLFCDGSAKQIVEGLVGDMRRAGVRLELGCQLRRISKQGDGFSLQRDDKSGVQTRALVVATGGFSVPKMGASGFGYRLARQFGLPVEETRPGLVPLVFDAGTLRHLAPLAGLSVPAAVKAGGMRFAEGLLFTHSGLSGPSILQASSYWREGQPIEVDLLPGQRPREVLDTLKRTLGARRPGVALAGLLPRRLAAVVAARVPEGRNLADLNAAELSALAETLGAWRLAPIGSKGYRVAEVTVGGVSTAALNARTLEAREVPGLYFIGEVVDVTGWLGGYNFQWAWSSGWAAGQVA